jgi:predicted HTH transcriptional regulator
LENIILIKLSRVLKLAENAGYYRGMIDVWGRGTKNIVEMFDTEGLAKPIFEESGGYTKIAQYYLTFKPEM